MIADFLTEIKGGDQHAHDNARFERPLLVDDVADSASETAESVADSAVDQLQSFGDLFSFLNINNLLSIGVRVLVIVLVLSIAYRVVRTLINRAFKARTDGSAVSVTTACDSWRQRGAWC